jgi:tetratricopeptide (TPR) repeat protein
MKDARSEYSISGIERFVFFHSRPENLTFLNSLQNEIEIEYTGEVLLLLINELSKGGDFDDAGYLLDKYSRIIGKSEPVIKISESIFQYYKENYSLAYKIVSEVTVNEAWLAKYKYLFSHLSSCQLHNTAEITNDLLSAFKEDSLFVPAILELVHIQLKQDQLDNARNLLKTIHKYNISNEYIEYFNGVIYMHEGHIEEAVLAIENSIRYDPDFILGYYQLGYIAKNFLGDDNRALEYLKKCIELDSVFYLAIIDCLPLISCDQASEFINIIENTYEKIDDSTYFFEAMFFCIRQREFALSEKLLTKYQSSSYFDYNISTIYRIVLLDRRGDLIERDALISRLIFRNRHDLEYLQWLKIELEKWRIAYDFK